MKIYWPHELLENKYIDDLTKTQICNLLDMIDIPIDQYLSKKELVDCLIKHTLHYKGKWIDLNDYEGYTHLSLVGRYKSHHIKKECCYKRSEFLFDILRNYILCLQGTNLPNRHSRHEDIVTGKFNLWLHDNRDFIDINADEFLKNLDVNEYGNLDYNFLYSHIPQSELDRYVGSDIGRRYFHENVHPFENKLPDGWATDVKIYLQSLFTDTPSDLPIFQGFTLITKYSSGLPYMIIKDNKGRSIQTPQFGLNFETVSDCIDTINDIPYNILKNYIPYKILIYYNTHKPNIRCDPLDPNDESAVNYLNEIPNILSLPRAMGYLISKLTEDEAKRLIILDMKDNPGDNKYNTLLENIVNLPILSDKLCSLLDITKTSEYLPAWDFWKYLSLLFDKFNLSHSALHGEGWLITDYLKRDKEVWKRCKRNYLPQLPFYIQDYLPEDFNVSIRLPDKNPTVNGFMSLKESSRLLDSIFKRMKEVDSSIEYPELTNTDYNSSVDHVLRKYKLEELAFKACTPKSYKFQETYDFYTLYWVEKVGYNLKSVKNLVSQSHVTLITYFILSGGLERENNYKVITRPKNSILSLTEFYNSGEAIDLILHFYGLSYNSSSYLSHDEKIDILERGYIYPLPYNEEIIRQRAVKWDSYTKEQKNLLLINTPGDYIILIKRDIIRNFYKRPSYEKLIEDAFQPEYPANEIMKALLKYEIVVPYGTDPFDYVYNGGYFMRHILDPDNNPLSEYDKNIENLSSPIECYSDIEILSAIGGMINYNSREELVRTAEGAISGNIDYFFFFPLFNIPSVSRNKTFLRDIGSTDDRDESPLPSDSLFICLGDKEYNIALNMNLLAWGFGPTGSKYGVAERTGSIHSTPSEEPTSLLSASHFANHEAENLESEARAYSIYDWENSTQNEMIGKELSYDEVKDLLSIVKYIKYHYEGDNYKEEDVAEVDNLIDEIEKCIDYVNFSDENNKDLLKNFNDMTEDDQKLVVKALTQLFYTGMYFRQWDGKGNFPLEADKTGTEYGFNADEATAKARLEFEDILESMSEGARNFIYSLNVVESTNGKLAKNLESNFQSYWNGITGKTSMEQNKEKLEDLARYTEASKVGDQEVINEILAKYGGKMPVVVVEGTYCIRMASIVLVGTGFYYGKLFGGFKSGEQKNYRSDLIDHIY